MKATSSTTRVAATLLVWGALTVPWVHADSPAPPQKDVLTSQAPVKWHALVLNHVSPSTIAWQIDPAHNDEPPMFQESRDLLGEPAPQHDQNLTPDPLLPTGIKRITPVDTEKLLLVLGTDAAVQELEKVVALLDRPVRQVEMELQVVQVTPEDARSLEIDFSSLPSKEGSQIGFTRGNYQAKLALLVKQNKAKILTAPRVTVINNLAASLPMGTNAPFEFVVTPTIFSDDYTVRVFIHLEASRRSASTKANEKPDVTYVSEAFATVRDGDTLVLTHLPPKFLEGFQDLKNPENLLLLITPRIVRRVGDDVKPN